MIFPIINANLLGNDNFRLFKANKWHQTWYRFNVLNKWHQVNGNYLMYFFTDILRYFLNLKIMFLNNTPRTNVYIHFTILVNFNSKL